MRNDVRITHSLTMTQTSGKRVALITGCSEPSSLGALLALELAKVHDYRVFASARRVETLKGLAAEGLDVSTTPRPRAIPSH